jgi:hypothetical protein
MFSTSSVTSIGESAFMECTSLTSITIPTSVNSISNNTFRECTSLTSIIIPTSVISIGNTVFEKCTSLISITIPVNVTKINDGLFYDCTKLATVNMSGATVIDGNAFHNADALLSLTVAANGNFSIYGASARFTTFVTYYNDEGKYAGTYKWNGSSWYYQN